MSKILIALPLLLASQYAIASVDYITITECPNWFIGKHQDESVQDTINKELKDKLNAAGAAQVDFVQYGNQQGLFRSDKNACTIATAWFHK
jgi:hypothetical protein